MLRKCSSPLSNAVVTTTRQVLPAHYLPNEVAMVLGVDNSNPEHPEEDGGVVAVAAGEVVYDEEPPADEDEEFEEDEFADFYDYGEDGGAVGRAKAKNKQAKKGATA